MDKCVLFSPIGSTDPISGQHDGPMIHICRKFRPHKVYLYLSKEMCQYHDKDNRYIYTLEELGKKLGFKFEWELIRKEDLVEVQLMDYFYDDFEGVLKGIVGKNEGKLLLNVSSGTPAMKSALQNIAVLADIDCVPVQVATHAKRSNDRNEDKKKYDKGLEWECNLDNLEVAEDRCKVSEGDNLLTRIRRKIILKHISVYDYNAALNVAESMKLKIKESCLKLLQAAAARVMLDQRRMDKILDGTEFRFASISSDVRPLVESVLWLQMKVKRGEYVDFVRGITPAMTELFRLCLKNACGIDIERYCVKKGSSMRPDYLKAEKLEEQNPRILDVLDARYREFKDGFISSEILSCLIERYCDNEELVEIVKVLNKIDGESVRHIAAHAIATITDEWIKKQSGYYCHEILNMMKKVAFISCINNKKEIWDSYDEMNEMIKRELI